MHIFIEIGQINQMVLSVLYSVQKYNIYNCFKQDLDETADVIAEGIQI